MRQELITDLSLSELSQKERFRIIRLTAKGEIRRRLVDMGFISGTEGILLREALLRDPLEIQLKGYKISIRRAEAKQILVSRV